MHIRVISKLETWRDTSVVLACITNGACKMQVFGTICLLCQCTTTPKTAVMHLCSNSTKP